MFYLSLLLQKLLRSREFAQVVAQEWGTLEITVLAQTVFCYTYSMTTPIIDYLYQKVGPR